MMIKQHNEIHFYSRVLLNKKVSKRPTKEIKRQVFDPDVLVFSEQQILA